MLRAVLWDMDGTLLEPNGSIRGALNAAVRSAGFDPFEDDEVLIGMPLREILHRRTKDARTIESMVEEFRRVSYEEAWRLVAWYPGVRETVQWCRDQGLKTAVVTTKGELEAQILLEHLGDEALFDVVIGDDDERALKPHPAPVQAALAALGVRAREAVMVGDTQFDVEAGKAAGCRTVGVAWGHGGSAYGVGGADFVVQSAPALQEVLQGMLGRHNP